MKLNWNIRMIAYTTSTKIRFRNIIWNCIDCASVELTNCINCALLDCDAMSPCTACCAAVPIVPSYQNMAISVKLLKPLLSQLKMSHAMQFSPCKKILFDTLRYNINDVMVINGAIMYCKVSEPALLAAAVCSACGQTLIKCQYNPNSPSYNACLCD